MGPTHVQDFVVGNSDQTPPLEKGRTTQPPPPPPPPKEEVTPYLFQVKPSGPSLLNYNKSLSFCSFSLCWSMTAPPISPLVKGRSRRRYEGYKTARKREKL
ncbi:unnamed protein product [Arctogadus glacialis]